MKSVNGMRARAAVFAGLAAIMGNGPALAQGAGPFAVSKVSVDVTAGDAVAAKEKALSQAKRRALRTVFKRLASYPDYGRLPELKDGEIDGMLNNFSIRREQNSRTRYLATIDFTFSGNAVRQRLDGGEIGYSDVQSPPLTVLPVFIRDGKVDSTGRDPWRKAWLDADLAHAMTPVNLVRHGDSLDAAGVKAMLAGEGEGFAALSETHKSGLLVLAIADVTAGTGKLDFTLYGVDASGPFALEQAVRIHGGDVADAALRAAALSLGVLEGRWKVSQTVSDSGGGDPARHSVALTVEFSSLGEWRDIRSRLSKVPGVRALEIASLSARSADVTFRYPGGARSLAAKLPAHGMSLMDAGGGALVLRGE